MPEKSAATRIRDAKKRGTPLHTKAVLEGRSRHGAKKSSAVSGRATFVDRNVAEKRPPGVGRTRRSERLPEPDRPGSTSVRRATHPNAPGLRRGKPRRKTS